MADNTKGYGARLRALREEAGLSQGQLGEMTNLGQSAISKLESESHQLTLDKMVRIAHALNKDPKTLLANGVEAGEKPPENATGVMRPKQNRNSDGHSLPATTRSLPVRGIAQGGNGRAFMLPAEQGPVDWTFRPPILEGVMDAYALFVFEDSMSPMYKHGQVLWVHPFMPPAPGNGVVIVMKDGETIVKELVRRTARAVTVRQYRPEESDFDIPADTINTIHHIVGVYQSK